MSACSGPGGTAGLEPAAPVLVLIGPPGAGCSSVGAALARLTGRRLDDLGAEVARSLEVEPGLALVAVGERAYRSRETDIAVELLEGARDRGEGIVALGSGCLEEARVRVALEAVQGAGARLVALSASVRCLAHRNGLDAPRSVALGAVNHTFTQMLHARSAICRALTPLLIETTGTSPDEAALRVLEAVGGPGAGGAGGAEEDGAGAGPVV